MPDQVREVFIFIHSPEIIDFISKIVNLNPLLVDEKRWGGGLHKTKKGGYLSVHKDFTVLPTSYKDEEQMLRCVNLIGYLNSDWKEEDGGHLEFWDSNGEKVVSKVPIKFNRWVIFDTRNNYHGHPIPYQGETPRISIASYYYTREKIEGSKWSSTEYLKLPWMEDSEEYQEKRRERSNHEKRYGSFLK
jgi:Rps23 Pro-64 3,4-dihydroxylase Tpa1-like proline 4-hydroxylase